MKLIDLVGNGDKVMLFTLPFIVIGFGLNILFPEWFSVGGPAAWLQVLSIIVMIPGVVIWLWSVYLILSVVPKHRLITWGPYAVMKHPIYTGFGLLVIPWIGFLIDTWVGIVIGGALYAACRLFAPDEEKPLEQAFGDQWKQYTGKVLLPWL